MSTRFTVLVADTDGMDVRHAYDRLTHAGAEVIVLESKNLDEIAVAGADADALLVSSAPVPSRLLESMPRLRLVSCMSTGVDHVDIAAAKRLGIRVAHLENVSTGAVASHALALALAAARELPASMEVAQSGNWTIRPDLRPLEPDRLTLGIVGLGRIGSRFAEMASGVFERVLGFDVAPPNPGSRITRRPASELAAESDIVSLHLPATVETRALVQDEILPNLNTGSILVNVSRGDLIPAATLLSLLENGTLRVAALDVLPNEPPAVDDPLLVHPRTIVTPHYAFLSEQTAASYPERQVDAVLEFFQGHNA